jgi:hypothetical protein
MKRTLIGVLFSILLFTSLTTIGDAQRGRAGRHPRPPVSDGKINPPCPKRLNNITDCMTLSPDTGCGSRLDPHLNVQKNIRSDDQTAEPMDIADIKALPDPVSGFKIGDTREKLKALGEGKKITVVAWALVARSGSSESCNCKLTAPVDTDNHIVLIDPSVKRPTLAMERRDSITAEFAPRVRLDHPKLAGSRLQSQITTGGGKLLVRITGLLMFDSEHSFHPLAKGRANNWEIHPVMGLEFCPKGEKCTKDSDDNWVDLEQ